jgi:hypothetical protein
MKDLPLVELVVHCYAVVCPHYAQALTYLLSSLVLHTEFIGTAQA